mmetsp:Transcript_39794/g.82739  ORF Transcript_39794/g.82739 Transcript_39794/m.82739 type:complete len:208 (-) Transcript_39794:30-653(-)
MGDPVGASVLPDETPPPVMGAATGATGAAVVGAAVEGAAVVGEAVVGAEVVGAAVVGEAVVGAEVTGDPVGALVGESVVGVSLGTSLGAFSPSGEGAAVVGAGQLPSVGLGVGVELFWTTHLLEVASQTARSTTAKAGARCWTTKRAQRLRTNPRFWSNIMVQQQQRARGEESIKRQERQQSTAQDKKTGTRVGTLVSVVRRGWMDG